MEINQITEKIIGCAFVVGNTLGSGFLEKVYENALAIEIENAGLAVRKQHPIKVPMPVKLLANTLPIF